MVCATAAPFFTIHSGSSYLSTYFEDLCSTQGPARGTLSQLYLLLTESQGQVELPWVHKWELDLGRTFTAAQRRKIVTLALKSSVCSKIQETNYKVLTRWYLTPSRLHRCFPEVSDRCWRCGSERGTLLHVFWSCPRLSLFWGEVHRITQRFVEGVIPLDPALFLLHLTDSPIPAYKKSIIGHLLNAAKACIPLLWKQSTPPSVALWLNKVEAINKMEDLVLTAQHKQTIYSDRWRLWNMFILSAEGASLLVSSPAAAARSAIVDT